MSVQEAMTSAIREVLSAYLAPELTEQLTEDIVQRAMPDMEAALMAFVGFELGANRGAKGTLGRGHSRPTKGSARNGRKRAQETDTAQEARASRDEESEDPALGDEGEATNATDGSRLDPMAMT